jgi:predicted phage tail protein
MITIRNIENPFKLDQAQIKRFDYSRSETIRGLLDKSGFDYKDKRVIVTGKRIENLDVCVEKEDEIIIIPEVRAPVVAIVSAIISSIWAYAAAHPFIFAFFVLSLGYSIYQYMNQPKMPDFNLGSTGLDEGSPTYGWDGVRTIQEVGVPVAVVYGEHKVGGNIINQFIRDDGDKHYLNVLLALCEGEIEAVDSIEVNNNPINNFDGIDTSVRYGTNDQSLIEDFEDLHNLYTVNVNLLKDNPHIYETLDSDVEGFEVLLRLNNGLYRQSSGGGIGSWSVRYKVEYKLHVSGTWIDLGETTISDNSRSPVRRTFRKAGLVPGKYDIRVTRTSDDSTLDPLKQGDLAWYQVDELKTDSLNYPNTALLGLKLLATNQLSGGMPNITSVVKGKKVLVPNILNGITPVDWEDYYWDGADYRLFSDDTALSWDGVAYVEKYSANPVWCLRDFVTNNRYGLGEFINIGNLDMVSLLEMSRYCEEKIGDGQSGHEKRFRMDVVIDSNTKALDVLIQLCATFNAMPVYSGGGISFKIDKQANPTQLFSMGNIVKDSFAQSWKTLKEIPNVIEIQFMDKDKGYRQETIAYIDEDALAAGDPMRKSQVRLFTTRASYAIRAGRYALKVAKYINRSVSFKAGVDAVACQAGDIISISHDVPQWGFSGRVSKGSSATLVKLDREIILEDAKSYKIQVRFSDDTIEEKAIVSLAGSYTEIECEAFSAAPQGFDVYAIGETNKVKKDFRVVSIQREGRNEVLIAAMEYNENVYDDSDVIIPDNNYSSLQFIIPLVSNVVLSERILTLSDGTIENSIDVCFELPDMSNIEIINRFKGVNVYYSDNDGLSWYYAGYTQGNSMSIIGNIEVGSTYKVCVASVTYDGQESAKADSPAAEITITGNATPPHNVSNFAYTFLNEIVFTWDKTPNLDLAGYEIRTEDVNWGVQNPHLVYRGLANTFTIVRPGSRTPGTYYIKAYNTTGNYSVIARSLSPTNAAPPAPTITATQWFGFAKIEWTDTNDEDLRFYEVYRSATNAWEGEEVLESRVLGTEVIVQGKSPSDAVADSADSTSITDAGLIGKGEGYFVGDVIKQTSGDYSGQEAVVIAFDNATGQVSVASWDLGTPSAGDEFVIKDREYYKVRGVDTFGAGSFSSAEMVNFTPLTEQELGDQIISARKIFAGEVITLSAQIKNAIINNAKISDLDAGKINAGYLSADRIQANSITADKISAGTFAGGNFIIGVGGVIQSSDYVANTTGFKLSPATGLEVNTGGIAGNLIRSETVPYDACDAALKACLLTAMQVIDLTDGNDSALHYHPSDRDSANFTGAIWTDLTDGGESTRHYHASDRNSANFTGTNWGLLTSGGVTTLHSHNIIKSIQRGRISSANTSSSNQTISSVTLAKAFSIVEIYVSQSQGGGKGGGYLTGSTTLNYSIERDGASYGYVYWKVIEFY